MNATPPSQPAPDWNSPKELPIGLGGSVFGWLIDAADTDRILDRFFELGGRLIDTSDGYSYAARAAGGDSESLLGSWARRRGVESDVRIITKVGLCPGVEGLSASTVARAVSESQDRLGVPRLEAVLAHADDEVTAPDEIAGGLAALLGSHARHIGVSRFIPSRLQDVLAAAERNGLPPVTVIQEEFSLAHRGNVENLMACSSSTTPLGLICSAGLARGFLTGKFQHTTRRVGHRQTFVNERYCRPEHSRLLDLLQTIATAHHVAPATIALSWLKQHPAVTLPLASVTRPEQLDDLARTQSTQLSNSEWDDLNTMSMMVTAGE